MAAGFFDPNEWWEMYHQIKRGDDTVIARLADRDRKLDNYFDSFDYKPELMQPTNTVLATTSSLAHYTRIGRLIFINAEVVADAAGTTNTDISITLPPGIVPVTPHNGSPSGGSFFYEDFSTTTTYTLVPHVIKGSGTNKHRISFRRSEAGSSGGFGRDPNIAVGSLDRLVGGCFFVSAQAALL